MKIEQQHRDYAADAAVSVLRNRVSPRNLSWIEQCIRQGEADEDPMVQAFARFEQEHMPKVDDAMVERATMELLGKESDPSPGVDWLCSRTWTVNQVRFRMHTALTAALGQGEG